MQRLHVSSTSFTERGGAAISLLDRAARKLAQSPLALFVLVTALSVMRSLQLGQDANWDLQNYHFYNAFALVRDRFDLDLAPAMAQTYFNPVLDLPFYGLVTAGLGHPKLIAALMAVPYAIAVFFANKIAWQALSSFALPYVGIWWLFACLVNVTGAAGAPLVASTMNDPHVAALVLAAVWIAVRRPTTTEVPVGRDVALSGFLMGLSTGVKLTAAPYAVALCVALAIVQPNLRRAVVVVIAFVLACTAGLALSAGPWMLFLYHKFHNPLFPFFNAYFQSPFWESTNLRDTRWEVKSLWSAVALPYVLMHETQGLVGELPIRDWRLAAVATACYIVVVISMWRTIRARSLLAAIPPSLVHSIRGPVQILVFFVVGYALWLKVFAYYRYLLPLEMLTGTLLVGLLVVAFPNRKIQAAIAFPVMLAVLIMTRAPDWGRTPFNDRFFEVRLPPIASGSLVLLLDSQPLAYLIPFFPEDTRFVGPWWSLDVNHDFTNPRYRNLLQQQINNEIAQHRGPLYSIELAGTLKATGRDHNSSPGSGDATLPLYGLRRGSKDCQAIKSNLGDRLVLCSLERAI